MNFYILSFLVPFCANGMDIKLVDSVLNLSKYRTNIENIKKDPYYSASLYLTKTSLIDIKIHSTDSLYREIKQITIRASNRYKDYDSPGQFSHEWISFKREVVSNIEMIWKNIFDTGLSELISQSLLDEKPGKYSNIKNMKTVKSIVVDFPKSTKWDSYGADVIMVSIYFKRK